jgi:hypothetical protein
MILAKRKSFTNFTSKLCGFSNGKSLDVLSQAFLFDTVL